MFRILEKAIEGHGYTVVECYLYGEKAGTFRNLPILKINETLLRAKADDLCEQKLAGGTWVIASKQETQSLISEFNSVRKKKGWPLKEFKRVDEWLNPQDEGRQSHKSPQG